MASVALCCVVSGAAYHRYAADLFDSARRLFFPDGWTREFVLIEGSPGWPHATMLRPHHLVANMPDADFVFLCDADMLFAGTVGAEILPPDGCGLVVTLHPGYWRQPPEVLPFENRVGSECFVPEERRAAYYAGGFWGGSRWEVLLLARAMAARIDADLERGITPVWHDESALNAVLATWGGPHIELDPSYCHPDRDDFYVRHVWGQQLPRRLVALDKSVEERAGR